MPKQSKFLLILERTTSRTVVVEAPSLLAARRTVDGAFCRELFHDRKRSSGSLEIETYHLAAIRPAEPS